MNPSTRTPRRILAATLATAGVIALVATSVSGSDTLPPTEAVAEDQTPTTTKPGSESDAAVPVEQGDPAAESASAASTTRPTTTAVSAAEAPAPGEPPGGGSSTSTPAPTSTIVVDAAVLGSDDPATTVAPTLDDLEGDPSPDAGEAHYTGIGTDKPVHPKPPAPTWSKAALVPFEDPAPPVFVFEPAPVDVPPVDDGPVAPGQLVGNEPGCLSDCITHALLIPAQFQADVTLDMETNVATRTFVWVSEDQPVLDGGYPVVNGWPTAWNPSQTHTWETTFDLEFSTSYWIVIKVEDQQNNDKWAMTQYTTIDSPTPDELHANGDGCYFQCINFGSVERTDSYDRVNLVIGTSISPHEDVDFDVAVSTSEPGTIAGKPFLPHDHAFVVDQDGGNDIRGHVSGLAADTTYHVVVKATDEDGFTSHAVGEFRTDPPPPPPPPTDVRITWERMHVVYDGDAGAWGRGEIAVAWGLPTRAFGWLNEDKLSDGASVQLNGHTWVSVEAGDSLPSVIFTVHENDTHGNIEYDYCRDARQEVHQQQWYNSTCTTRVNFAMLQNPTLDFISTLPPCKFSGLPAEKDDDRCIIVHTADANDKHAQIDVLVSFHIAD